MKNMPVRYLENEKIKALIDASPSYRKSAETLLRLPQSAEKGTTLETFVKDGSSVRKESSTKISDGHVIARNKEPIGCNEMNQAIFNEWPVSFETIIKNYGEDAFNSLTTEFKPYKKFASVKAIELDQEMVANLGFDGNSISIEVDWSEDPMVAKIGDYLTSGGYSISAHDMKSYEAIQ